MHFGKETVVALAVLATACSPAPVNETRRDGTPRAHAEIIPRTPTFEEQRQQREEQWQQRLTTVHESFLAFGTCVREEEAKSTPNYDRCYALEAEYDAAKIALERFRDAHPEFRDRSD